MFALPNQAAELDQKKMVTRIENWAVYKLGSVKNKVNNGGEDYVENCDGVSKGLTWVDMNKPDPLYARKENIIKSIFQNNRKIK